MSQGENHMEPAGSPKSGTRVWGWPLAAGIAIGAIVTTAVLVPTLSRKTAAPRPTTSATASPNPSTSPSSATEPAACTVPEGAESGPLSLAAFTARVVGTWQLCGTKSIFGDSSHSTGIEFTAEHHWYALVRDSSGNARGQGFDKEGTWAPLNQSTPNKTGPYQLDMRIEGSGMIGAFATFASGSPKLRLLDESGTFDYVKVGSPSKVPVWPDEIPSGFVRRAGVQAGFAIDIPKDWKGGWFEGVWDFEPSGLPSTSEDGNTVAVTVTVEPGDYKKAFAAAKVSALAIQGRAAITTSPDATHTFYAVDWSGCAAFAPTCPTPVVQRLIIRVMASTQALWDQYHTQATQAAMSVLAYDGSDPVHGVISGGTKSNAHVQALARFMDARVEGIGAEGFMCCSAPKQYQTIGLYGDGGRDIVSYEARVSGTSGYQTLWRFDVTIHYEGGKTRIEHVTVTWENGQRSSTVAPKVTSATT